MASLTIRFVFAYLVACGLLIPTKLSASETKIGGPEKLTVGQVAMQKNGSGFRKKSFITLYEGTLYLTQRSQDAAKIVAADSPMAIRLQIKSGFVSQQKMMGALEEGFKKATNGNTSPIAGEIQSFRKCFGEPINKGDVFVIAYLPDRGVSVLKNGQLKGSIAGIEFKKAVFGIWLSPTPVDANLKSSLLGR